MGKGGAPDLSEALLGDKSAPRSGSAFSIKKLLCVCAQFAPYFLMWYGFFLIVNDIIRSNCPTTYLTCRKRTNGVAALKEESVTTHADMFACDDVSTSSDTGIMLIIGLTLIGVVVIIQFILLLIKTGSASFGSLRMIVWLEVAKEKGTVFNTCTLFAACIILTATVISLIDFITKYDDNVNDLLSLVFQALTSLYTAYELTTYNSPVTSHFHAQQCPDIMLDYPWWLPSEDIVLSIHYMLALDVYTAHGLLQRHGGDATRMEKALDSLSLGHNDAALLASLGKGAVGVRHLEMVRDFFSHPPTRSEVYAKRRRQGRGVFSGPAASDPGLRIVRNNPKYAEDDEKRWLRAALTAADSDNKRLREELQQRSASPLPNPVAEHSLLVGRLCAVAGQLLHQPDATHAAEAVLQQYPAADELWALLMQPQRLEQEITRFASHPTAVLPAATRSNAPRSPRSFRPRTPPIHPLDASASSPSPPSSPLPSPLAAVYADEGPLRKPPPQPLRAANSLPTSSAALAATPSSVNYSPRSVNFR